MIDGYELPGSCYENPSDIALLKTDDTASSHGTHTLGTAAGSYKENGWHGVACDADIVVCGMPEQQLTDVNIANAVKYIFDYADRVGKDPMTGHPSYAECSRRYLVLGACVCFRPVTMANTPCVSVTRRSMVLIPRQLFCVTDGVDCSGRAM